MAIDPVTNQVVRSTGPGAASKPDAGARTAAGDQEFAAMMRQQLEAVSQMQAEANEGVQRLLTGESQNITEVFSAARKAEVAFSLLMELRNKLVDAYEQLRQVRV